MRIAVVILLALTSTALAQQTTTQVYRVKQKDTLDVIAAEYYGDRAHAVFIIDENKIKSPAKLAPGTRLRIPVTKEITTTKGQTIESLAVPTNTFPSPPVTPRVPYPHGDDASWEM